MSTVATTMPMAGAGRAALGGGHVRWIGVACLTLAVLAVLGPFAWILTASFKYQIAIYSGEWPFTPTLSNHADVLLGRRSDFTANVVNSLVVASVSTALVLVVGHWPRIRCTASAGPRGCRRDFSPGR